MKIFEISINGHSIGTYHATKARIAINKAMTGYRESCFNPCATIKVRFVGTMKYTYIVKAHQRDENEEDGRTFKRVDGLGPYKTRKEASEAAGTINATARQSVSLPTCDGAKVYKVDQNGRVSR